MIEAVKSIGDYIRKTSGEGDTLRNIVENPGSRYKHVLLIVLKEKGGVYSFSHVDYQELKSDYTIYLYKGKKGNSPDLTPTCRITEIEKTFNKKFLRWFNNYENYQLTKEELVSLQKMGLELKAEKDRILAELKEKFSYKKSGENGIITLGIESDEKLRYLIDIPIFRNVLLGKGCEKFSNKYGVESIGRNSRCAICMEIKKEVYGFAIPWAFHTFDKPGFIAGGFDICESWKNTPICCDCAGSLEVGKKYIEESLSFDFYGFRYLLVPKLVVGGNLKDILDIISARDLNRKQRLSREMKRRLTADENEILDLLEEEKDFFSNSLIFYRGTQSSFRILLLIDGILPSRLRALFKAKETVDERFKVYYDAILSDAQKEKVHLEFNFGVLRRFFHAESRNRTYDKIFLEIVNKIFVGNNIDYHLLVDFIMREIRDVFIKEEYSTNVTTLNGFMLLQFIGELDLFRDGKGGIKKMGENGIVDLKTEELEELPLKERIERFFGANKAFFDGDAKKAAFLEGGLAQNLLNIQWNKRKSTPFRAKLHGLKMNESLIKRLLPEIQNKLEEYDSNYYRELEEIIAAHFVQSGVNWKETDDELSFYFVLGMDMHKLFRNVKEEEKPQEEALA